jgi:hypothetical protein
VSHLAVRNRNLFFLLSAGCVLALVAVGLIVARQPRRSSIPVNTAPPLTSSALQNPEGPREQPAAALPQSKVRPRTKQTEDRAASNIKPPRKWLYFRGNSSLGTSGTFGETLGKLAVAPLDALDQKNESSELICARLYFRGGKGVCAVKDSTLSEPPANGVSRFLRVWWASFAGYSAVLFDQHFKRGWSIPLHGLPSRIRVSPSGRLAAVTVFLSGQSYSSSLRFSTQTIIIDVTAGKVLDDLEKFAVTRYGEAFQSPDFNFWGVTFIGDENRFYATLWSKGKTYLVEGNLATRAANVIFEGVECPSLSPDNTRIAFKKRSEGIGIVTTWRITILDLRTLTERPLAETRSVDDQVEWLDNHRILYALPEEPKSFSTDIWELSDDANARPRFYLKGAFSPAVVTVYDAPK